MGQLLYTLFLFSVNFDLIFKCLIYQFYSICKKSLDFTFALLVSSSNESNIFRNLIFIIADLSQICGRLVIFARSVNLPK